MSLEGISKSIPQPLPKSCNFLAILWPFPTGQASVNLCLCHYGYIRMLNALSDLTHVSWELLFHRQMVDTSLRAPQAGLSPLGLASSPAAVTSWPGQQCTAQNHSPVQPLVWQPQRHMHHTHMLSFSYSQAAGEIVPGVSRADSLNLCEPVIWPLLRASALGFAEGMNAWGT